MPAQRTQVVQKLRPKHKLELLLSIAQLPRTTFYYHLESDRYEAEKAEIAAIYHENCGRYRIPPDCISAASGSITRPFSV